MLAVLGSALTAFAILAIALSILAFNHPNAPRWLRRELTAQLSAVSITIILGAGLACLVVTAAHVLAGGSALAEVIVPAGALALVVVALRALKVGARLRDHQSAATALVPPAA